MAERGIPGRRQLRSACGLLLLAIFGAVSAYGQTPQEKAAAFAAIKAKWESLPGVDSVCVGYIQRRTPAHTC